jgi:hypothetical protein
VKKKSEAYITAFGIRDKEEISKVMNILLVKVEKCVGNSFVKSEKVV